MKLLMFESRRGAPDGERVRIYKRGEEVDVPDHLARAFMHAGVAMPALRRPKGKYAFSRTPTQKSQ